MVEYTWFIDDGKTELRRFLYLLEADSIVIMESYTPRKGVSIHRWKLSKKGERLIENNKELEKLWRNQDIEKFYNNIKDNIEF